MLTQIILKCVIVFQKTMISCSRVFSEKGLPTSAIIKKASQHDMLTMCGDSIYKPLNFLFKSFLETGQLSFQ